VFSREAGPPTFQKLKHPPDGRRGPAPEDITSSQTACSRLCSLSSMNFVSMVADYTACTTKMHEAMYET
jgi:hypothetical protein